MKRWKKWMIAGIALVVVAAGVTGYYVVIQPVEYQNYMKNDLPLYRDYDSAKNVAIGLDCNLVTDFTHAKKMKNPFTHKTVSIPAYTLEPRADTQKYIDITNQRIAIASKKYKLGDLFANSALGSDKNKLFIDCFEGDKSLIEQYREKLNSLDGVTNKLTLQDVISDPVLANLAMEYAGGITADIPDNQLTSSSQSSSGG